MAVDETFPLFTKSLGRHLSGLRGLKGINAFLRDRGQWIEVSRLGQTKPELVDPTIARFDPKGGGEVEALAGEGAGWVATYMVGGPGLDLVLILILDGLPPSEIQSQLSLIEAKVGWLMIAALSDRKEEIGSVTMGTEIGAKVLLDAASAHSRRQLADQWIARLERALAPDLIAVVWIKAGKPKMAALSGGGVIERNSDARSQIEALADYAVRARAPLVLTPRAEVVAGALAPDDEMIPDPATQTAEEEAHARVETLGGERGLAMPIYHEDEAEAVVVAIWAKGSTAGPLHPEAADLVADVLGEALAIQARAFPSIRRRLGNWLWAGIRGIFGPTAWKLKVFLAITVTAVAGLSYWPTQFTPSFTARIEAQDRRVVSAPFDGFLAEAPYQLGDAIRQGAVIVAMEDSEILLQAAQGASELAEIEAQLQTARAQRDSAKVQSLEAQARQVEVQQDLVQRQLELARFEAPQNAIVVGGDAWRRVGGRVRLGEPLLELAAPDTFRVLAFIDEDWVADLTPGSAGTLLLAAHPATPVSVTLTSITTDPQLRSGINTFSAWMELSDEVDVALLDGMRGVVKIDGPQTSMLLAYTRGTVRWLRRTLWRWG